jgi:AraC-like DNA-binding protein
VIILTKLTYSSEREYDGYLRINSCGKQWLADRDYDILLPEGRIDFSIRYTLKGLGYCVIDGKSMPVNEGNLVVYFPKTTQRYGFKKSDDSIILWAHFSGTACELLKNSLVNSPSIIKIQDRKQFESAFEKMILSHYKKNEYSDTLCNGYMTVLISLIAQSNILTTKSVPKSKNENLEKILSLMHFNYNQPIDIKEYAKICCVGEDHFIRLFKAYTGLPPYNYQLKIRINRAIEMLENTPITIKECADVTGFNDITYFSKVFKRFTGHPPSHYKK